jgi:16S rRNA (guanine1207-N2)-methyltransferase
VPQYFDEQPAVASRPGRVRLQVPGVDAELSVDRGVFSAGGIDPGTVELLRSDPGAPLSGDVLDLGCGYGPIAVALARRHPEAVVWAVDVNARARELAAANATELGLDDRVRVAAPGDVPAEVRFSAVWSNPPIRIGKAALHEMLSAWLPRLTETGQARLVVHKHLGSDSLAAWLAGEGWAVRRLGSRKGYRILEVARTA